METVTIACPVAITDPDVDAATAPIWLDADGNQYAIASGMIEGRIATDHTVAMPDRVTVFVGVDGLFALAAMGLRVNDA
jgi:hypothetical protein